MNVPDFLFFHTGTDAAAAALTVMIVMEAHCCLIIVALFTS
jgi:hypothetical protein